jgi:hypothetical protein
MKYHPAAVLQTMLKYGKLSGFVDAAEKHRIIFSFHPYTNQKFRQES